MTSSSLRTILLWMESGFYNNKKIVRGLIVRCGKWCCILPR